MLRGSVTKFADFFCYESKPPRLALQTIFFFAEIFAKKRTQRSVIQHGVGLALWLFGVWLPADLAEPDSPRWLIQRGIEYSYRISPRYWTQTRKYFKHVNIKLIQYAVRRFLSSIFSEIFLQSVTLVYTFFVIGTVWSLLQENIK